MEIKRGDIFYVGGGYATGSEQHAGRPAIVVSNDVNNEHSSTVEMVYLTTRPKRDMPTCFLYTGAWFCRRVYCRIFCSLTILFLNLSMNLPDNNMINKVPAPQTPPNKVPERNQKRSKIPRIHTYPFPVFAIIP